MGVLATLDSSGWTYSDYPTHLAYVKNIFQTIYGAGVYLEADSQDGQLCAALATAMYDNNQTFASVINSLSPVYAQGVQLSNEVLINGISRKPATNSTVTLTLTGTVGTVITSASAKDANNNIWNIADGVIAGAGTIDLLATSASTGAITALPNTITIINTPILGWTAVNNTNAATTGQYAESDYLLRQRQTQSVALPSLTTIGGLKGGLLSIPNVTRVEVYENPTSSATVSTQNPYGLPANSITSIVEGGDGQTIANQINLRKTIGCFTNGTSSFTTTDSQGITALTSFSVLAYDDLKMAITIHPLTGYISSTITEIQNALASMINGLYIGEDVLYSRLYTAANLNGSSLSLTYNITALQIGTLVGALGTSDIVVPYNQAAKILTSNIVISVV